MRPVMCEALLVASDAKTLLVINQIDPALGANAPRASKARHELRKLLDKVQVARIGTLNLRSYGSISLVAHPTRHVDPFGAHDTCKAKTTMLHMPQKTIAYALDIRCKSHGIPFAIWSISA